MRTCSLVGLQSRGRRHVARSPNAVRARRAGAVKRSPDAAVSGRRVQVMLPLRGYKYIDAARRAEGLLNRCRGKIPNLTKFTSRIDALLNIAVGLTAFVWTFFLFREPRHGPYHEAFVGNSLRRSTQRPTRCLGPCGGPAACAG